MYQVRACFHVAAEFDDLVCNHNHPRVALGLKEAYKLLGIAPGSQLDKVKSAYRQLVWVWHPDRMGHNPRMQKLAGIRLRLYNEAYALITGQTEYKRKRQDRENKTGKNGHSIFMIKVYCPACKECIEVPSTQRSLVCPGCGIPLLIQDPATKKIPLDNRVSPWGDCLGLMQQPEPWPAPQAEKTRATGAGGRSGRGFGELAEKVQAHCNRKNRFCRSRQHPPLDNLVGMIGSIVL